MSIQTAAQTAQNVESTVSTSVPKLPKTATITLTSNGVTLTLRAHRLRVGAETFVTTTDTNKVTTRGMTESHPSFEVAKAAIAASAEKATKLGWVRKEAGRGFVAMPDAFSELPKAPKAAPPKAKK